jgi:hypothetical protein
MNRQFYQKIKAIVPLGSCKKLVESDLQTLSYVVLPITLKEIRKMKQSNIIKHIRNYITGRFKQFIANPINYVFFISNHRKKTKFSLMNSSDTFNN